MSDSRTIVTKAQLASAIAVYLTVMPKRIWREFEKFKLAELERRQGERPKVEREVAEHIAQKLAEADWQVSRKALPLDRDNAKYIPAGKADG